MSAVGGFAEGVAKLVSAVSHPAKGSNAGIDSLGAELGGIIDKTGDRMGALFGDAGLSGLVAGPWVGKAPEFSVPAGGAGGAGTQIGKVENRNHVEVTVQGGNTNAETGKAVARAVKDALTEADLRNAAAAR